MNKHIINISLLILFCVWYFINEIYKVFPLVDSFKLLEYIGLYASSSILVYFISFKIKKDKNISWIIAQIFCIFLLLYGYSKDKIGGLIPIIDKHSFFIPFWIIINISLIYFIKKININYKKLQSAIATCLFLFILYSFYGAVFLSSIKDRSQNIYTKIDSTIIKPNIYLIVFDELSRLDQLNQYGYDSQKFISHIDSLGLKYLSKSYSYSDVTPVSMSNVLNASVTDVKDLNYPVHNFDKFSLWSEYTNNHLVDFFKSLGYENKLFGILSFKNLNGHTNFSILKSLSVLLLRQNTFIGRINEEISWNLLKYNVPVLKDIFINAENKMRYQSFVNDSLNLLGLKESIKNDQKDHANFTLAHFMYPHYPLTKDSLGNYYPFISLEIEEKKKYNGYIQQVKYTEKVMSELITLIKEIEEPTIAIFMGDHGYRASLDTNMATKSFLAYYSNLESLPVSDSISAVNLMRTILNKHFGYQLELDTTKPKILYY